MKHTTIIIAATTMLLSIIPAMADEWHIPICCMNNPVPANLPTGCASASMSMKCPLDTYVNCTACKSGYTIKTETVTISCTSAAQATITLQTCQRDLIIQPVTCMAGQYKNGMLCANCPDGGTSVAGATAITQCYKPKYETTFSDSSGNGVTGMANDCYYTE